MCVSEERELNIRFYAKQYVDAAEALKRLGVEVRDWDNFGMVEIHDLKSGKVEWCSGIDFVEVEEDGSNPSSNPR